MSIFRFLSRNGFFSNKSNARTHTIMSGGTLFVAEDSYDEFLGIYADEIERGNRTLAFSELRSSPVFRMYFDVDIMDTKVLGDDFLLKISRSIQSTAKNFFPEVDQDFSKCVVCSTATKDVEVKEMVPPPQNPVGLPNGPNEVPPEPERVTKTFIKNGYHILFPFLRVTLEMALQLRFSVVADLEKNMGKRSVAVNPWSDVIDRAPYYNGLKMCGSVKSVTCTNCNGKKKNVRKKPSVIETIRKIRCLRRKLYPRRDDPDFDYGNVMSIEKDEFKNEDLAVLYASYQEETGFLMCPTCGDKGWHLEDRYYIPVHVLDSDGSISDADMEYLNDNMHEMMRWTSIRCRPSDTVTEGYTIPPGYATPPTDRATSSLATAGEHLERLSPGIYREAVNADMFANDVVGIRTWKGKEITDDKVLGFILKEVRSFNPHYEELEVRQVFEMQVAKSSARSSMGLDMGAFQLNSDTSAVEKSLPASTKKAKKTGFKALENICAVNNTAPTTERVIEIVSRVLVRVSGPGSTYCINKGDEHTTNSIFFWISHRGISQKCFSRKDVLGSSGKTCKEYHSDFVQVSQALSNALFRPDSEKEESVEKKENTKKRKKGVWSQMCAM